MGIGSTKWLTFNELIWADLSSDEELLSRAQMRSLLGIQLKRHSFINEVSSLCIVLIAVFNHQWSQTSNMSKKPTCLTNMLILGAASPNLLNDWLTDWLTEISMWNKNSCTRYTSNQLDHAFSVPFGHPLCHSAILWANLLLCASFGT